jgi:hypothetical protein|tara:strand:+ start:8178 stop:9548 length:1371 start_codon:yes stop_codon:yes gene_type:complete
MASILTPNTFQVKIKEEHVVNGIRTLNENQYDIPNVTNYDRRIVTVPADTNVDLINTNGPTPGPALFPSSSIAYGRITNMDDSSRLAVTFTSSAGLDNVGLVGKNLSGSYTSGGTLNPAATAFPTSGVIYTGLATTTSGTGTGLTLNVTQSAGLVSQAIPFTAASTTTQIGTYTNVPLGGSGTGTGALGTVKITSDGFSAAAPSAATISITDPGKNYAVGDVLTIAADAIPSTALITGGTLPISSNITGADNGTSAAIPISSNNIGSGASVVLTVAGNVVSAVTVSAIGGGFAAGDTITISQATLRNYIGSGTTGDLVCTLIAGNINTSTGFTLRALVAADRLMTPIDVTIASGGSGYSVGDTLIVSKSLFIPSDYNPTNDLVYTLTTDDFAAIGAKSYWTMECLPTSSIMFSSPNVSGSQFNGLFEQDIEFISVRAISSSIDVEYVLVNAPVATN